MLMKHLLTLAAALLCTMAAHAYSLQTIEISSKYMQRGEMINVILPDSYTDGGSFPVVYLLHGYIDNHNAWLEKGSAAPLADAHNVILVMPDTGYNSWYLDSPLKAESQAESYIIEELIPYIDSHYRTIADRSARAITGLSMGGHGALYLAFRHQELFGFVGSMSGGVDLRPFPGNWDISSHLGTIESKPENWEQHSVINLVELLKPESLKICFDCGVEDFFYEVNCNLHHKLLEAGIPHDFTSRPGAHTWEYWQNSINYHLLFFARGFAAVTK